MQQKNIKVNFTDSVSEYLWLQVFKFSPTCFPFLYDFSNSRIAVLNVQHIYSAAAYKNNFVFIISRFDCSLLRACLLSPWPEKCSKIGMYTLFSASYFSLLALFLMFCVAWIKRIFMVMKKWRKNHVMVLKCHLCLELHFFNTFTIHLEDWEMLSHSLNT